MDFLKQNGKKVIRDIILIFFIVYVIITFIDMVFYFNSKNHEGNPGSIVPYLLCPIGFGVIVSLCTVFLQIRQSLSLAKRMKKMLSDTSGRSIAPLFDDFSIAFDFETSKYFFTAEYIKGHIAGLPVHVRYHPSSKSSFAYISFEFLVAKKGYIKMEDRIDTRLDYYVNIFTKKLRRDIKPDILNQAKLLKENAYLPVEK